MLKQKQVSFLDFSGFTVHNQNGVIVLKKDLEEVELKFEHPDQKADFVNAILGIDLELSPQLVGQILDKSYANTMKLFNDGEIQDFREGKFKAAALNQVLRLKAGLPGLTDEERTEWAEQFKEK